MNDANHAFENNNECSNTFRSVQKHRLQNPKNAVIGHLTVNSLRNKFEAVKELVQNKVDICFLSETFPNQQFVINGYKLFIIDRNCHGGGILCCVNENISSKTLNVEDIEKDCEFVLIESSIKTCKWLCIGLYKPPSENEDNFLDNLSLKRYNLSLLINRLTWQYENFMSIGDFNMTIESKNLGSFYEIVWLRMLN